MAKGSGQKLADQIAREQAQHEAAVAAQKAREAQQAKDGKQ